MSYRYFMPILIASAMTPIGAALASGSTTTLASVGAWSAFGGTANDGRSVCGMSIYDRRTGRFFGIKHFDDKKYLVLQAIKPSWRMQKPTQLKLYMKFDDHPFWTAEAIGNKNTVEWTVRGAQFTQFIREFQSSERVIIGFPQGTETPWTASLSGSAAVTNVWLSCMNTTQFVPTSPAPAPPELTSPAPTSPAPQTTSPEPAPVRSDLGI